MIETAEAAELFKSKLLCCWSAGGERNKHKRKLQNVAIY